MKVFGIPAVMALLMMRPSWPVEAVHAPYHSPMALEDHVANKDLSSILQVPSLQQHERISEALHILHPIQSGPRCHYNAALNLLNDCKFLEESTNGAKRDVDGAAEADLGQLETVYAARLAVCELMSANADIPPDCKVVTPSEEACVKKRFGYGFWNSQQERPKSGKLCYPEEPNPKQFNRCMKSLHLKPQSWMSYSNARLNAVVMCHASRDAIEKDKNLAFYKNLGEAVSGMASILESYNEKIQGWLSEHNAQLKEMRTSTEQVVQNVEQSLSTFETITNSLRSLVAKVSQASQATESYSEEINESLEKTKASLEENRHDIQEYHKELVQSSFQHASVQRNELDTNHHVALAALQSHGNAALEILKTNNEATLSKVSELSDTIKTLQGKIELSSNNIEVINQGLVNVNKTIERLDAATENLPQVLHVLTTVGGIFSSPQPIMILIAIFLIVLWKANGKISGYIIAGGGLSYMIYLLNIPGHLQAIHERCQGNFAMISQRYGTIGAALCILSILVILSVGIHSRIRSTYLFKYEDVQGEEGVLPSIETPGRPATPAPRKDTKSNLLRALHLST